MRTWMENIFHLRACDTTIRRELMAGFISFVTIVYIVAVNASILQDAGIPMEAGILATVFTAFAGALLMAFWANAPIILVPGMGINALFTYTLCHTMGLSWQEALAAVFVSGILFAVIAFTRAATVLSRAIPASLKEAITVGIGLFLTFIGLQKGGLIVTNPSTFVALGELSSPHVIVTLATLVITLILFVRNVPGNFLIGIAAGTGLGFLFGIVTPGSGSSFSFAEYANVFSGFSFGGIWTLPFWIATFSLAMVIVFENIGLIHGHTAMAGQPQKFRRALQANAVSAALSGMLGSSPTVATVESAAGIAAGGRTGLTSLVTGTLLLGSLGLIPVVKMIPDGAIAPVLIIIGALMLQNVQNINLKDFSEGFPAFLIIAIIPLSYSIVDGIAFGFVAYPLLKLALGKRREVPALMYVISGLFLLNLVLPVLT
ncbi:putative MFS transporter, AGZA family, xanthine/uracil permease [Brevibacillus centrosporus]|uniref:Putative MFS transporter, AGZA family, xanthine/uracil permease n=2 Tax=Brevibacillus centrosporus TaxID=54910 RepID=A0A1I3LEZ1_9BACL|nr:putative MFS transporter, AGZA family, xanthine/uracil permease [Brevibacillus centrosporus]